MNTCDTCQHWKPDPSGRLGDCLSEKWLRGYGIRTDEVPPDGVRVEDDEGWAFATGPKFGCVHWQLRP